MSTLAEPRVERFRFRSFDQQKEKKAAHIVPPKPVEAKAAEPPKPAPPPAPTFSEKDMQVARDAAYKKGHSEGHAEAEAKLNRESLAREEALRSLLEVIANRITLAAESFAALRKSQDEVVSKLAVAIARKFAADVLKREPYAIPESLLRECLDLIAGKPRITIAVPPGRAEGLRQHIGMLTPTLQGFTGEIQVTEDATIAENDCRVEWGDGHAEHNSEAVWLDIQAIIAKTTFTN